MRRFALTLLLGLGLLWTTMICKATAAGAQPIAASPAAVDPAVRQEIERWITAGVKGRGDREAAEVALSMIPTDSWPAVEAAAEKAKGDAAEDDAKQWLSEVLERQRPYVEARARRWQIERKKWEWNRRTALEAYDRAGHKNPKWDDAAMRGISGFVGMTVEERKDRAGLAEAVQAGCDDPLVNYFYARDGEISGTLPEEQIESIYQKVVDDIEGLDYPADRKLFAFMRYFQLKHASETVKARAAKAPYPPEISALFRRLAKTSLEKLWPAVCEQKDVPPTMMLELSRMVLDAWERATPDRKVIFDQIYPAFEKTVPNGVEPLVFKGYFYYKYAWDARGGGWADTVTPEGWQKMRERLAEAEAALTKAYELDPKRDEAATEMLVVELGQGKGRDVMQKWFERAMAANPDNKQACRNKAYYLEPKWHGSAEDIIAFGRECRQGRNWQGDIAFQLIEAHERVAGLVTDKEAYFAIAEVWQDVRSVYEPFLAAQPKNAWARSRYAYYACLGKHWEAAERQFRELGDAPVARQFGGADAMEEFRRQAHENAAK